jgi:hypothetical protein
MLDTAGVVLAYANRASQSPQERAAPWCGRRAIGGAAWTSAPNSLAQEYGRAPLEGPLERALWGRFLAWRWSAGWSSPWRNRVKRSRSLQRRAWLRAWRRLRCGTRPGSPRAADEANRAAGARGRLARVGDQEGRIFLACFRYSSGTASQRSVQCTTPSASVQR